MNNVNIKMILLSCVLTAVVLFGGWFTFQFFNTDKPIQEWIDAREGMEIVEIDSTQSGLDIEIRFDDHRHFGQDYLAFVNFLNKTASSKDVRLNIAPAQGEHHPFWLEHSPQFLELLHQHKYAQLDTIMSSLIDSGQIVDGQIGMTSERVFIYIQLDANDEVYMTLPLITKEGGERL